MKITKCAFTAVVQKGMHARGLKKIDREGNYLNYKVLLSHSFECRESESVTWIWLQNIGFDKKKNERL